jgi:hypothetical protein
LDGRIEPEMAFANLEDDMDCAEAYIRHAAFSPFLIALRLYALIDEGLWDGLTHWVQKTLLTGLATSRPGRRTEIIRNPTFPCPRAA